MPTSGSSGKATAALLSTICARSLRQILGPATLLFSAAAEHFRYLPPDPRPYTTVHILKGWQRISTVRRFLCYCEPDL
jgi:hypothetical protein